MDQFFSIIFEQDVSNFIDITQVEGGGSGNILNEGVKGHMWDIYETECCCPLPFFRKYFKRLKQSFSQFWAVMLITRNTIKRRHWRKVNMGG